MKRLFFFLMMLATAGKSWSQDDTPNINDKILAGRINYYLHELVLYTINDYVSVEVTDGVANLSGWVRTPWISEKIAKYAEKLDGIRSVNNQIELAQGSDILALRATRAIYQDIHFGKYLMDPDPPVRVIVVNNSLILAGNVLSEQERHRAEWLADVFASPSAINNQLTLR